MTNIKFKLIILSAVLMCSLGFVGFANAAYNDVTIETDTVIRVGNQDFNVFGSNAVVESITIGTSNFSVGLLDNSSIGITSSDRTTFTLSPASSSEFNSKADCSRSESRLTLTGSGNVTVTITPDSDTCGSGGGGGVGGAVATLPSGITLPYAHPVTAAEIRANIRTLQVALVSLLQQLIQMFQSQLQGL